MTLGAKYKWKPLNENPPPGIYNADKSLDFISKKQSSVVIKNAVSPYKKAQEIAPEPG